MGLAEAGFDILKAMQKSATRFILAALALVPCGCKTDQGSKASSQLGESGGHVAGMKAPSPSADATPSAEKADLRPIVVCFGDSLTAGYGAEEGKSYPDYLQSKLDGDGYRYRVVNEGVSGNTTKDGLDRLSDITQMKAELVVVEFGGNDGLRGLKVETTHGNLGRVIKTLKDSGEQVVLAGITLPPDYGRDYISRFTAIYPQLARQYKVPLLPFVLKDVYGVPGLMQADRTHATAKGNEVVARNVGALIEPLLKK